MADTKFKKGSVPWNKGKIGVYTPEQLKKMSEALKGRVNKPHSEETKRKIGLANSISLKGNIPWNKGLKGVMPTPWNKGVPLSDEVKRKMSEILSGKRKPPRSEEHRKNLSESMKGKSSWNKGKHLPQDWKRKIGLANLGKKRSEEEKKKMGDAVKKAYSDPELRKRISEAHKENYPSEETKLKMREKRAEQIFPFKDSKPEIKIQNFLKQLNINFLTHRYMIEIKHKYQCDIFVPSMNLIIEVDGDYWHGNTNNSRYAVLNKNQVIQKEEDDLRTKELIDKGFKVLRLWESDINKMNLNDFMERIKSFEKV